jgi:excisionase family DNA binding protein
MALMREVIRVQDELVLRARREAVGRVHPAVWLSGQQAADHVGVSWPTLRRAILDHAIPHVRLGRRWKIEASVLDAHLRRLASGSTERV